MDQQAVEIASNIYLPKLCIRLLVWFGIYFAASAFEMSGMAIKVFPGEASDPIFLLAAERIPSDLQLLIVGFFELPYHWGPNHFILSLAYGCFLLNFLFCLTVRGKKTFWILISFLIVLIFLSFYGSSLYVSQVFEVIPATHVK